MISVEEMLKSWVLSSFLMLLSPVVKEVIPPVIRNFCSFFGDYFIKPQITVIIEEKCDLRSNQIYEAARVYLRAKISDSNKCLKVRKPIRQKKSTIDIVVGEEFIDRFENIELKWKHLEGREKWKFFELSYAEGFTKAVLETYLPYVITYSKAYQEKEKVVKRYSRGRFVGEWDSVYLEHPATFEKLAMDPELKRMLKDDLHWFVNRKKFYKKVGKVWKRGYLLYGPPGTGKSTLISAMANYLKFDIYDLDISSINSDSDLRRILLSTSNRSIMAIRDTNSYAKLEEQQINNEKASSTTFTQPSLLNAIDELWSSCGDERIIVFTTNSKDKLDPALLRPGRLDVHVPMSYCTIDGFKLLASNYLDINGDHELYGQIERLLENVEVTPAEIAEKLLNSGSSDDVLGGLVEFLEQKILQKAKAAELKDDDIDVDVEGFVKFPEQKKLRNAKAAEAEQLFKSDDTDDDYGDVHVKGLVKLFKQKKLEDAKAPEAVYKSKRILTDG